MSDGAVIGIDLGTTFSLVSIVQDGKPVILENSIGETLTPSVVSLAEDGSVFVGAAARARLTTHPTRTAALFKRDMGTDRVLSLGDKRFRAEELSALVLQELRRDAEVALGMAVREAVVTVPAYFGESQRRATKDACEIAGLHVERLLNEPTAAALAYGLDHRGRDFKAVVLDLGGGTFDVTVLEVFDGVIEIQASAGDARLGGEDFTDALVALAHRQLASQLGVTADAQPGTAARLREAADAAKHRLTTADNARLVVPGLATNAGPQDVDLALSRVFAEQTWEPLLRRMRAPIDRALHDAKLEHADVHEVLLVGGATRMPCVINIASKLFGKLPLRHLPADEAVAMGAAVQAALKSNDASVADLVATDIAPFTLGVGVFERDGTRTLGGLFSPILERGTVLPASRVERYTTLSHEQNHVRVVVYQGEHSLCADNVKLGELTCKGIPKGPAGKEGIDVRFTYDLNGILEVDATVVSTGKTTSAIIERSAGQLTPSQVAAARKAMQGIKVHPRDHLPNTTAIARADALFAELSGDERALLGRGLAAFRLALDAQEPREIERARKELVGLTAELRRGVGR